MAYDNSNVFAKILRGEIPCQKVYEDDIALAFYDIAPSAPVHVLVIPKFAAMTLADFVQTAGAEKVGAFFVAVQKVVQQLGIGASYRLITNSGAGAGQSVPHFHVHLLAGKPMGPLLPP
ncbi:MAG: histidine triad nucleotide-binding protein [Alphaproteobacteria bacterium]|jgi:histidine triad (HIT) family protein